MKKLLNVCLIIAIMFSFVACGENNTSTKMKDENKQWNTDALTQIGMSLEEINVTLENLEEEYRFIYISDLHIIVENEQIASDSIENVNERLDFYRQPSGITSAEAWNEISSVLDSCNADAILIGGDMVDYASSTNIQCFINGMKNIETPVVYVGADHDFQPYYCENVSNESIKEMYDMIDGNEEVPILELEDLCIVGINNATSNILDSSVSKVKEAIALGKPIFMLTHVPLNSLVDSSLSEESKEVWGNRALVWGENCYYVPNNNTAQLLELVYAQDSLVKEVFSGHLHFTWDGQLTENTHQHVFDDAASGHVGIITVSGAPKK